MKLIETPIRDLFLIEPTIFNDPRGYFFESYNYEKLFELGIDIRFVQDNESFSCEGVIRGLHYQLAPFSQTKLIRVVEGIILDVALDIRKKSPTYGQHYAVELNSNTKQMLLVPKGFAHGFSVLSKTAIINYKCDSPYNANAERGVNYNDPKLAIDWKVKVGKAIISAKDKVLPMIDSIETNFIYGSNV